MQLICLEKKAKNFSPAAEKTVARRSKSAAMLTSPSVSERGPGRHAEIVADLHQRRDAFGLAGFCDDRSVDAGAGIFAPCRPLLGRDADEADEWVTASPEEI